MNEFTALCQLASDERWCWKLCCTTCGHLHFKYSFVELADGKSPMDTNWKIHVKKNNYDSPYPREYPDEQKERALEICKSANLLEIAKSCIFPDWLGYLGLVLEDLRTNSDTYKELSKEWAIQLTAMLPPKYKNALHDVISGERLLNINDLEFMETNLIYNRRMRHRNTH